jgi:hypothetical protein
MQQLDYCALDYDLRTIEVAALDGQLLKRPMSTRLRDAGQEIRHSRFDFKTRLLTLRCRGGEHLEVEIGHLGDDDLPPAQVPVVYLDQNQWVLLARTIRTPQRLPAPDREAAEELISWARQGRVLLPLGSGHFIELPRAEGSRRRDLASTMLGLCRGWTMRNPIWVRKAELSMELAGLDPRPRGVFTREPDTLFVQRQTPYDFASEGPEDLKRIFERITSVSAIFAALLDEDDAAKNEGYQAMRAWAESFTPLAEYMRERRMGPEHARINARARLIADLGDETAFAALAAGASQERFSEWLQDEMVDALKRMPYLGRYGELIYHRLRNADDKWRARDLIDMNFLACAAGYASVVVGEKHTMHYLNRAAGQVAAGALLFSELSPAVSQLATVMADGEAGDVVS